VTALGHVEDLDERSDVFALGGILWRDPRERVRMEPWRRGRTTAHQFDGAHDIVLAMARFRLGEKDEARALLGRALEWRRERGGNQPEIRTLFEEAQALAGP
jgi:hypothetical protein